MPLAVMVVALCFLGVVTFALHRRRNVSVSMSIFRRLFEFTINAKDTPPLGNAVNSAYWSKEIQHGKPVPGAIRGGFIIPPWRRHSPGTGIPREYIFAGWPETCGRSGQIGRASSKDVQRDQ